MDIFGKIFDKVEKTTKKVVSVSEGMVEIAKIKFAINQAESKIEELNTQIGALVYDAFKNQVSVPEEVEEKCKEIQSTYIEIDSLKTQLASLKKIKVCDECGKQNDIDAHFCIDCGAKFARNEVIEISEE